ncbi:MAG: GWxTD domain-containing protein [Candidatus Aminicenantes bacterium]|nr:MAG: GWxTD domain-containing protein [Candidatus Aminicenantes bacterium]
MRFIITKNERKIFLRLDPSERKSFIEEFWAKRDPDPFTEENEYKEEYFSRIERANRLFRGEGTPGWLTDRGRVYILFGAPFSRKSYPADYNGGITRPREVWYYGNFPIVFVDRYSSGVFRLVTTNLAILNEINVALRRVREEQEKQINKITDLLIDFNLELAKSSNVPVILVKIPYKNIWFEEKDNVLETTLYLAIRILNTAEKIVLQHDDDYFISLNEKSLLSKEGEEYVIEIPLILAKGEYSIQVALENETRGKKVFKELKIKI